MENKTKYLISIVGPTAVGKTALAIKVSKHFKTEIISADSRQFFAEMSIGTAKPSEEELQEVKHHFIGNVSINQLYSAGDFERDALLKSDELFIKNNIVIMVGGSGLYTKAVLEGFDELPKADEKLRTALQQLFDEKGIEPLQEILKNLDAEKFETIDSRNTQRVMRAIEIATHKRKSPPKEKVARKFTSIKIGLNLKREDLYNRINYRVDQMMDAGLIDEVKSLIEFKHLNALQTLGYTELFDYFDKKHSLEKATELIKQHTRNFAKRQLTWFGKEKDIQWFPPDDEDKVISFIEESICL